MSQRDGWWPPDWVRDGCHTLNGGFSRIEFGVKQRCSAFVGSAPVLIGRHSSCDICIRNKYVSRFHLLAWHEEGGFYFRDLGSLNGTVFDGSNRNSALIRPGAIIYLGAVCPLLVAE